MSSLSQFACLKIYVPGCTEVESRASQRLAGVLLIMSPSSARDTIGKLRLIIPALLKRSPNLQKNSSGTRSDFGSYYYHAKCK